MPFGQDTWNLHEQSPTDQYGPSLLQMLVVSLQSQLSAMWVPLLTVNPDISMGWATSTFQQQEATVE